MKFTFLERQTNLHFLSITLTDTYLVSVKFLYFIREYFKGNQCKYTVTKHIYYIIKHNTGTVSISST